jgi:hypothetical protein
LSLDASDISRTLSLIWPGSSNPEQMMWEFKERGRMKIDRDSLESVVGEYLEGGIRSPVVDRFLITAIADMEITAYLDQVQQKNPLTGGLSTLDVAQRPIFASFLKTRLRALLISCFLVAAGILLDSYVATTPGWLTLGLVGLGIGGFAAGSIIHLIMMLIYAPKAKKSQLETQGIILAMLDAFSEMHAAGPVSVRRIREKLEAGEAVRVSWPSSIWPLLEDVERRGALAI